MSAQTHRLASGGAIDRSRTIRFSFDGQWLEGHPGDTLASALVANHVRLIGRSFKYHRPRGLVAAGPEEPNALVTIGDAGRATPNSRATMVALHDGLVARSQNAWPSLGLDIGAVNGLLSPFFPAGFYYKTFMGGPRGAWTRYYEPIIRRAAGLGPAPTAVDPDRYDKRHAHCDVLVVGAGPAGLAAARAAGAGGARVILIDERAVPGGSLLGAAGAIDGRSAPDWAAASASEIAAEPETRLLLRTTAFGRYDHNCVMAVERIADGEASGHGPRERLWQIRAGTVILATGAHEQPLLFGGNDLPGIMLANAGQLYARHYAALVGRRVVIAMNNDSGHAAARAMVASGASVTAVDCRTDAPGATDYECVTGAVVQRAIGGRAVRGVEIASDSGTRHIDCDAVLMSGGWQPALHLHSHAGGKTRYDPVLGCFVADAFLPGVHLVGGCAGRFDVAACLADGHAAGLRAAGAVGRASGCIAPTSDTASCWSPAGTGFAVPFAKKSFVDFQNDVTVADIDLAHREGFVSVEHLKRYTTTGMATDQGKLSNLAAIGRMAMHLGVTPDLVGTTTFRPPYTPVTFGALAGADRGDLIDPVRCTPIHDWHLANGAVFEDVGQWKRPWFYPQAGEDMDAAVRRECRAVRTSVGLFDASTLGKIDLQGPDAAQFLNRVYTNAWLKLEVGRARYGLMCGEDGMLMDDGVTIRTGPERYLMTTTTGNAARVLDHLEDLLQTEWPDLRVRLTSVTDHWAACVVTGPRARDVLQAVASDVDLSNAAFPHLSYRTARIGDIGVRLYRISFTGELSYEVHVPAQHGEAVWQRLYDAGRAFGVTPYGTETMHVLRAEKGYIIIGQESDGTVTPQDLGLDWAIAKAKKDFVGARSFNRADTARLDRKQLVGLTPVDGRTRPDEGAQLTLMASGITPEPMLGHVTSSYWSVVTDGPIALALLKSGREWHGRIVHARQGDAVIPCRVGPPIFYDIDGERMHG